MGHGQAGRSETQLFRVPPRVTSHPALRKFGRFVREQREAKGLTQEDLAGAAGLDRTYISHLERGRRNPGLLHLRRLAKALGVQPSEFFDVLD